MKPHAIVFSAMFLACGGAQHEAEHGGEKGEHHEKQLSPELQGFHDVLKPVWHSDPGPTRVAKACDASTSMVDKVAATNDPELISAVSAMSKTCASPDRAQVEPQLTKVHERFHALIEK
jgi:hypothetical protein